MLAHTIQQRSTHQEMAMTETNNKQSLDASSAGATYEPAVGIRAATIYALVAHRLAAFYDHGYWITQAQGATLCSEWLMRSKQSIPMAQRRHLSDLSDQVATQIKNNLSREAGLYTAHELMESLDPRYISELGASIMDECVRILKGEDFS
jgi:hypothetical protein